MTEEIEVPDVEMTYAIKVVATGEVRDADGNLIEIVPIEQTTVVTESELLHMMKETEDNG